MKPWIPKSINIQQDTDATGSRTDRHSHDYVQAGFVVSGRVMIEFDPQHIWRMEAGEFFNIAQYQPHVIEQPEGTTPIHLRFKAQLMKGTRILSALPNIRFMDFMINETFKICGRSARRIGSILKEMLAFDAAPDDIRAVILPALLIRAAKCAAKAPCQKYRRHGKSMRYDQTVLNVLDIIHRHSGRPLAIKTIAQDIGISRGHLTRLFRRHAGVTPKQYLLRHRIEMAKRLLTSYRQPLKNIAAQTGFPDLQQFSRAFRRIAGCAPSDFLA